MTSRLTLSLCTPLLFAPFLAFADGMLRPGWGPVAEQALNDIRAAAVQLPPGDGQAVVGGDTAQPAIDAWMNSRGTGAGDSDLTALWQASVGSEVSKENGADRVARAFTLGNATSQLASSVYGGPPGAAAYAAWWAYHQPNATPLEALRVGVISAAALWDTQKDATGAGVSPQVVRRTSLAAALGGLAIAAAGGDEQAVRSLFFESGAAVLLQEGSRLDCLSATVKCQGTPGKPVAGLEPVASYDGMIEAGGAGNQRTALPRPAGSLVLERGWTLGWHVPAGLQSGALYPMVVLTRGRAPAIAAPLPAVEPDALPPPAAGAIRYLCEKQGDTRAIWVEAGNQPRSVCRTLYRIDKTTAVLWNAQQNPQVCEAKAEAQVKREQAKGYQCRPGQ